MNTPLENELPLNPVLREADRQMIAELRSATREEVIACAFCDVDSPDNLEQAVASGWTRLQIDDGYSWNYLGVCPDCIQDIIE